jgi:3-oxoacyl-[acyl-carrier protein] reductase
MDLRLTGRRVLVTGSSSGIGEATARLFGMEGAVVVVHGRDAARAEVIAKEIQQAGGSACFVIGDLRHKADTDHIAAFVEERGGVDILVNNSANGGGPAGWFNSEDAHWMDLIQSNLLGAVRLIQKLVPGMKARGWGRVINVGTAASTRPSIDFAAYSTSKAALPNMSVSLSQELGGTGVTVNTISPGGTRTTAMEAGLRSLANARSWPEKELDAIEKRACVELFPSPLGRLVRPEEVGAAILFVASDQAACITGANIRVDGGHCMTIN